MTCFQLRWLVLAWGLEFCAMQAPALAQQPQAMPSQPPQTVAPAAPLTTTEPFKLIPIPASAPLSPGVVMLLELEGRFAQSVGEGGGKAFATWFADDAVTLSNGEQAVLGRGAIAQKADWDPKAYRLSWVAQGAQMGPSNDMGFTWGHYEGRSRDAKGAESVTAGRYITIWRKLADGSWKVAMDASANEPTAAGACCSLPKP